MDQYDVFLRGLQKDYNIILECCDSIDSGGHSVVSAKEKENPLWNDIVDFMRIIHHELCPSDGL